MTADNLIAEVHVKIEQRPGGIYVSSKDVPGLWLWGKDVDKVLEGIGPAIEALYKYNDKLVVNAIEHLEPAQERFSEEQLVAQRFRIYTSSSKQTQLAG